MCYCFSGFAFRNRSEDSWYNDLWNESFGGGLKFVYSPYVILCGWLGSKHQLTNLTVLIFFSKRGRPNLRLFSSPPFHVLFGGSFVFSILTFSWNLPFAVFQLSRPIPNYFITITAAHLNAKREFLELIQLPVKIALALPVELKTNQFFVLQICLKRAVTRVSVVNKQPCKI